MLDVALWDSHSQELEHACPQVFCLVLRSHAVLCLVEARYLCIDLTERVDDEEGETIGRRTLDLCARQTNMW